jgi:predicted secreted Zn-dependent protease
VSRLMEQALQELKQLPEQDQDSIASIILQEIESQRRWEELFDRPESANLLAKMADEAIAQARAGQAMRLDVSEL